MTPLLTSGHAGDGEEGEQSLAEHGGCEGGGSGCLCGGGIVVRGVSVVQI